LLALIVATIISFYQLLKPAAVLLVPYQAFLCIATALNAGVVLLN
jgi:tryptophan-rich sensory protein